MGLFDRKPTPAPVPAPEASPEVILTTDGSPPRSKQAEPGGPETTYKLLGIMIDGEFVRPSRYELQMQGHDGITYRLGDLLDLTRLEYQVLSKRHVLIPVAALEA